MTAILVALGTVLSLYVFEPLWFDTRMHYYHNTYSSRTSTKFIRFRATLVRHADALPTQDIPEP